MKYVLAFIGLCAVIVLFLVLPFTQISVGHYSDGERTGLLNKVSKKGFICKTWEGYILVGNGQNIQPEHFSFTIKDETLAKEVQSKIGQQVTLEYDQKIFTASCWGETSYEVIGVR